MKKFLQTALVDEDVFDELCSYPDHRVKFIGKPVEICQDEIERISEMWVESEDRHEKT